VDQYFTDTTAAAGTQEEGGKGGEEAHANAFLRDYILNKGWIDREAQPGYVPSYRQVRAGLKRELRWSGLSLICRNSGL
jgi:hypothetical protein